MSIGDWPEDERPREKLAARGAEHLSDAELLAILIRTGTRGRTAVDVARDLTAQGIPTLAHYSYSEIAKTAGIGPARAAAIMAAFELGRRSVRSKVPVLEFTTPETVFRFCGPRLNHLKKERFIALALNTKNRLLKEEIISEGDLNSSIVHPREVFEPLIRMSAAAVVFVHNHPSGDPAPSQRDLDITHRLRQVGELLGIKVLDHVIVAAGGYHSILNARLLTFSL